MTAPILLDIDGKVATITLNRPEAGLAAVFDQDFANLPQVQAGLANLLSGEIQLADYQEVRIRHFHQTLDKYITQAATDGATP